MRARNLVTANVGRWSAVAIGFAVLAGPFLPSLDNGQVWMLRLAALTGVGLLMAVDGRSGRLLINPLFLLIVSALVFYSLVPAAVIPLLYGPVESLGPGLDPKFFRFAGGHIPIPSPNEMAFLRLLPGSPGEVMVLGFVGWATALLSMLGLWPPRAEPEPEQEKGRGMVWAWVALLGAGLSYQFGKRFPDQPSGMLLSLLDSLVPAVLLAMAMLWLRSRKLWHSVAAVLVGMALLYPFMLKAALLFTGLAIMHFLLTLRGRSLVLAIGLTALIPLLGGMAVGMSKNMPTLIDALQQKIVLRQGDTVFCLNFVQRQPADGESPFYMFGALVPRVLWPDKPSLSNGGDYARRYCGMGNTVHHSASVTLLGEPLARAGGWGMVVAGAIMTILFASVTWAVRRGGRAQIVVFALAPYVIDFDQLFGMYLALLIRGVMVASVVLILIEIMSRSGPGHHTNSG